MALYRINTPTGPQTIEANTFAEALDKAGLANLATMVRDQEPRQTTSTTTTETSTSAPKATTSVVAPTLFDPIWGDPRPRPATQPTPAATTVPRERAKPRTTPPDGLTPAERRREGKDRPPEDADRAPATEELLERLRPYRRADGSYNLQRAIEAGAVTLAELRASGRFTAQQLLAAGPAAAPARQVLDLRPVEEGDIGPTPVLDRPRQLQFRIQQVGINQAIQSKFTTRAELDRVFGKAQIEALMQRESQAQIAASRTARLATDPGATLAMRQLEQKGFATREGVQVAPAALEGHRGLLLQAGFTAGQIDAAVSQLQAPTATPRFIPRGDVFDPRTGQFGQPILDPNTGEFKGVRVDGVPFTPGISDVPWGGLVLLHRGIERGLEPLRLLQESTAEALLRGGGDPALQEIMARSRVEGGISQTEGRRELQELFAQRPLTQQIPMQIATDPFIWAAAPSAGTSLGAGAFRLATRASEAGIARATATPTLTHSTQQAPIAVRSFGEAVMQGRPSSLTVEASYAGDRAFLGEVSQLKDLMTKAITRRSIVPQDVLPNVDLPPEYGQFLLGRAPEGLRQVRSVQINMRPYPEYVRGGLEAERIVAAQTPQFPGVFTDLNIIVKEPIAMARMNSVVAELRGVPRVTIRTLAPEKGSRQMIQDADFLARRLRDIGVRVTRTNEVVVPPGEGWNVANPAFNVELRPIQRLPDARQVALNPGEISVGVDPATSSVRVMALSPSARGLAAPIDFTRQFTALRSLPPGDVGLLAARVAPTLNQALTMRLGAGRATAILERLGIDGDRPAELVLSELPQAEMARLADAIVKEATITPPGLTPEERLALRRLISRSQKSAQEIRRGEPRRVATLAPEASPELRELVARGLAPTPAPRPSVPTSPEPQLQPVRAPTVPPVRRAVLDRPTVASQEFQELVARGAESPMVAAPALTPRQVGARLAALARLASLERPLTPAEMARAQGDLAQLNTVALTPTQQARLERERERLRVIAPALGPAVEPLPFPTAMPRPEPFPTSAPAPTPTPFPVPEPIPTPVPTPTTRIPPVTGTTTDTPPPPGRPVVGDPPLRPRFRLPDGSEMPRGRFPKVVTWPQGGAQITLDLETGRRTFGRSQHPPETLPETGFRVVTTQTRRPKVQIIPLGVVTVDVSGDGLVFRRDGAGRFVPQPGLLPQRRPRRRRSMVTRSL